MNKVKCWQREEHFIDFLSVSKYWMLLAQLQNEAKHQSTVFYHQIAIIKFSDYYYLKKYINLLVGVIAFVTSWRHHCVLVNLLDSSTTAGCCGILWSDCIVETICTCLLDGIAHRVQRVQTVGITHWCSRRCRRWRRTC